MKMTKSARNCGSVPVNEKILNGKLHFLCCGFLPETLLHLPREHFPLFNSNKFLNNVGKNRPNKNALHVSARLYLDRIVSNGVSLEHVAIVLLLLFLTFHFSIHAFEALKLVLSRLSLN